MRSKAKAPAAGRLRRAGSRPAAARRRPPRPRPQRDSAPQRAPTSAAPKPAATAAAASAEPATASRAAGAPRSGPPPKPQRRRSFSQRNLALQTEGPLGELLGRALSVPPESGYTGTHAFHPYPGRFHPALPRTVLDEVSRPGQVVLDPFMGGGTTLVEALARGLPTVGNDLNPVALLVTQERTRLRTPAEAERLEAAAHRIAAQVEGLRQEKHPPRAFHRRQGELSRHYAPHLLAELMQWYRLIEATPAGPPRDSLRAVLSSAVVKFSNLAADSRAEPGPAPRRGKGAVSRFLVAKTRELGQAQVALAARIPPGTPAPVLHQEDARLLPSLGWGACDLVLTSPPYAGTYDYHAQHALRLAWLELDDAAFAAGEIGARRETQPTDGGDGVASAGSGWSESLRAVLGTLARVLRPGGSLFLVMGDWVAGDHPVDAANLLGRVAATRGWQLSSRASVQREVHSRGEARLFTRRGKWEHLLHFLRPATEAAAPPSATSAFTRGKPRRERTRSKGGRIRTL